ncbi:hypothetical protein [Clostridium thermobutyricum]|uniref:hypothetical protein n=1 Tax=Clostridium thermobutyricum TaxID=29372 RepID=UPI002942D134|nr:hypothetical protein [Clostridium thermobutyricum]
MTKTEMEFLEELQTSYPKISSKKLELYLNISLVKIKNYLNTDMGKITLINNYKTAIIVAIDNEINLADKKNISTIKEGNISITYRENSSKLSSEVKALLPRPFVKLMG